MKALVSFETSGRGYLDARRHISEERNSQPRCFEMLKIRNSHGLRFSCEVGRHSW